MALNWQKDEHYNERRVAFVPPGKLIYRIWIDHTDSKYVAVMENLPDVRTLGSFDSLEAAQAVCEADSLNKT